MKRHFIDVLTTDAEVSNSLDDTLHSHLEEEGDSLDNLPQPPDLCSSFMCCKDALADSVGRMVKNFTHRLQRSEIRPGSLLLMSVDQQCEQRGFFLGAMLRRPLLQTLVEATVSDREVYFKLSGRMPAIQTSHELFLELLRSGASEVVVEAWECEAFFATGSDSDEDNDSSSSNFLKVNPSSQIAKFSVTPAAATQAVHRPKLPASLRVRKPKVKKAKPTGARSSGHAVAKKVLMEECASSGEGSAGAASADEAQNDPEHLGSNDESEVVVPISASVAREQENMKAVAQEIQESDQLRQETAEAIRLKEMPPRAAGGSYFTRTIGLQDGALATTGRAVCLACKKAIAQNSVRFSYAYSRTRPTGWVHAHCVTGYILANNDSSNELRNSSKAVLRDLIERCRVNQSQSSSSKSRPVVVEIRSWAEKILKALE